MKEAFYIASKTDNLDDFYTLYYIIKGFYKDTFIKKTEWKKIVEVKAKMRQKFN